MTSRNPGEGRYAHVEREQRWLLAALPAGAVDPAEINDRYLTGTRLRLRTVAAAGEVVHKLTQKVRVDEGSPEVVKITNTYLSAEERDVVALLPGAGLHKTRWRVATPDGPLVVDEFHDHLEGLVLAEAELDPAAPRRPAPEGALAEVTDDDRFSGGRLAAADPAEFAALLDHARTIAGGAGLTP